MGPTSEQQDALLRRIRDGLGRAEARTATLRRRSSRFIIVNLVCGALGTIVAELAAAAGPAVGTGPHAWKLTCAAVAVLTASSTLFSGLNQQLAIPEHLARATTCVARLRALETETTVTHRDLMEVTRQYENLVANYQKFLL